jgi:pimeloyl-ACP methyl ester carboxylesterase
MVRWLGLAALLLLLAACGAERVADIEVEDRRAGPVGQPAGPRAQQDHFVPVPEPAGPRLIVARLCRPAEEGGGPRTLVLINHGKAPTAGRVAGQKLPECDAGYVRWFLQRGHAVFLPLRRGYGDSRGVVVEAYPPCNVPRDYTAGALEAARDMQAALDYALALPGIAPRSAVVVGQSAGGLGAVALASLNDRRVGALVSMAGGDGGRYTDQPNTVCQQAALLRAMSRFGVRARTPMLWVYTANDSYFGPSLAAAMFRAFTAAGGRAELRQLPAFGADGHMLFTGEGGPAVWGPVLERFLAHPPAGARATLQTGSWMIARAGFP